MATATMGAAQRRTERSRLATARSVYLADIAAQGAAYRQRAQDALAPYVRGVLAAADQVLADLDAEELAAVEQLRRELAAGAVDHLTMERLCALVPHLFAIPEMSPCSP